MSQRTISRIFLDLETLPDLDMPSAERRALALSAVPGTYSKPESIAKWVDDNEEEVWRKTSLDATRGRILCIGLVIECADGTTDERVFWNEDGSLLEESRILADLSNVVADAKGAKLVAHNGMGFDFPWLSRRAMRVGLFGLAKRTKAAKPWDDHLVDTLAIWSAPDRATRGGSLDAICRFLGLDRGANPISGADVYQRWADGDHDAIRAHVLDDVRQLRAVHQRFVACGWCS